MPRSFSADSGIDDVTRVAIADLMVHDAPMVLLDRALECTEEMFVAEVRIGPDTLFADADGRVPAWIGIEYMAQAVGAMSGAHARRRGEPITIGFLIGTRKYIAHVSHFLPGDCLRVTVRRDYEEDGLGVFICEIATDRLLAEARINTYLPDAANLSTLLEASRS
jgi:predicted hotdog family 3-hydroxylacyl-ACP dehydratase